MEKQYLLGFDVGSSSVKASLVDVETGQCAATAFYPESEAPIKAVKSLKSDFVAFSSSEDTNDVI